MSGDTRSECLETQNSVLSVQTGNARFRFSSSPEKVSGGWSVFSLLLENVTEVLFNDKFILFFLMFWTSYVLQRRVSGWEKDRGFSAGREEWTARLEAPKVNSFYFR